MLRSSQGRASRKAEAEVASHSGLAARGVLPTVPLTVLLVWLLRQVGALLTGLAPELEEEEVAGEAEVMQASNPSPVPLPHPTPAPRPPRSAVGKWDKININ